MKYLNLLAALLILTTINTTTIADKAATDHHSYANPEQAYIEHIDLDLSVNFEQRILQGHAVLNINKPQRNSKHITLDSRDLSISKVSNADNDTELKFSVGQRDQTLGSPLHIELPKNTKAKAKIKIEYQTSPQASGLQWLTPEQTSGKKHPFLFTQSQAIHARSWLPIQDLPEIRITYNATIRTSPGLFAVMSAENNPNAQRNGVYRFKMAQAIPSYLFALAVGDLSFKAIGWQAGVYAEPSMLEVSAKEFSDTQAMINTCVKLFGPYRWERYDLLVLPPSFPHGGMENPRLSFITPTVIAGDKSLINLIAHELAYSWSGNLVTNASWGDLWLNEGFTTYTESRIMEALFGQQRANMENTLGYESLLRSLNDLDEQDTKLALQLKGRDPDKAFSDIAYIKGQLFLTFLEKRFGREKFDLFLNQYFNDHAFKSISTNQFLEYLQTHLLDRHRGVVKWNEIEQWVYQPGLPTSTPIPQSQAFVLVDAEMQKWLSNKLTANELNTKDWVIHQWLYFLNKLPNDLKKEQLAELDNTFNFTHSKNNEIVHVWLLAAIKHEYQAAYSRLENYLINIGRRRLILPLYEALSKTEKGLQFANRVYQKAKPGYHSLTNADIDKTLADVKN